MLDVFCDEKDSSFALVFLSFVVTQDYDDGRDITEVLKYALFCLVEESEILWYEYACFD